LRVFLKEMVERNDNFEGEPTVFLGDLPEEYGLSKEDVEQLLEHPDQLQGLNEQGFHSLNSTLGRQAIEDALNRGSSVCASGLQKRQYELPHMKEACVSLAEAVGAQAVFAALHIAKNDWGSGQHSDTGWTFVYNVSEEGTKEWNLEPTKYGTLKEFLASRNPNNTDYINGPHRASQSTTIGHRQGLFIPTAWGHASKARGRSEHISYGGAISGVPLASVYDD
jgi:hypothetical protein